VITEPIEIACRRRCRASSTPFADGITSSEWHALSLVATLVSEVEGSDVQLRDKLVELARFDPYHQVVLEDTAAHLPGDHERQATKHLLFFDVCPIREHHAEAPSTLFVVRHGPQHSRAGRTNSANRPSRTNPRNRAMRSRSSVMTWIASGV